jgi:deoxyxylulose-5-phosphate synthase
LPPLRRLGIPDRFSAHYGSQQALMEDCKIDAASIGTTVRSLLARLRQ